MQWESSSWNCVFGVFISGVPVQQYAVRWVMSTCIQVGHKQDWKLESQEKTPNKLNKHKLKIRSRSTEGFGVWRWAHKPYKKSVPKITGNSRFFFVKENTYIMLIRHQEWTDGIPKHYHSINKLYKQHLANMLFFYLLHLVNIVTIWANIDTSIEMLESGMIILR